MDESTTNNGGSDQSSSDSRNDESLLDENQNPLADESDQGTRSSEEDSQEGDQSSDQSQYDDGATGSDDGDSDADGLAKFAKSQGIEDYENLSDREKRLLKVAHDNQKAFHQKSQEKSDELRGAVDDVHTQDEESDEDPVLTELAQVRANQRVTDFYLRNPEAVEYDKDMSAIVKAEADKNGVQAARYLASNLDNLLILAKAKRGDAAEMAREAGRKEERESIRKKQAASADSGQAQQPNRGGKKVSREDILAMDDAEYDKLRKSGELDEMIARGELY